MTVKCLARAEPRLAAAVMIFALLSQTVLGAAASRVPDNVRLANDVVPAPFGYESVASNYVVAEQTPLYVSPYIYPGAVNGTKLQPGQAVEALAKAKGYDWILVGKSGVGIGYIPISRLAQAKNTAR